MASRLMAIVIQEPVHVEYLPIVVVLIRDSFTTKGLEFSIVVMATALSASPAPAGMASSSDRKVM